MLLLLVGFGYGLTYATGVVAVNMYFIKHRPLMMGISVAGVSVGSFVNPMLTEYMMESYSWRGSLLVFSALSLHCCAFGLLFSRKPCIQQTTIKDPASVNGKKACSLDGMLFVGSVVTYSVGMTVTLTYVAPLAFVRGHSPRISALVLSCLGVSNLIGRILLGLLCNIRHVDVVLLYIFCYLLAGLAAIFLPFWYSLTPLIIGSVIFGFFSAGCGPVLTEVTLHVFGLANFAKIYGNMLVFMALGFMSGGPAAGM